MVVATCSATSTTLANQRRDGIRKRDERQDRVKRHQGGVTTEEFCAAGGVVGGMWEDFVAAALGLSLVGYLLYALVRPDRF